MIDSSRAITKEVELGGGRKAGEKRAEEIQRIYTPPPLLINGLVQN